jgi:hypothetical protein
MTTIVLVVVHRRGPDIEMVLGIFPSKEAAMPAFHEAIAKHDPSPAEPQLRCRGSIRTRAPASWRPERYSRRALGQRARATGSGAVVLSWRH